METDPESCHSLVTPCSALKPLTNPPCSEGQWTVEIEPHGKQSKRAGQIPQQEREGTVQVNF